MSSKLAWAAKPLTTAIAAIAPASLPGVAALLGVGAAVASGAAVLAGFIGLEAAQYLADKHRHQELTDFFKLSLTNDALTRNELMHKLAELDDQIKPPGFDPAKAAEAVSLLRGIAHRSEEQARARQGQEDQAWNVRVYLETITADVRDLLAQQPALVEAFAERLDAGFADMREHLAALHIDTARIQDDIAGLREVAEDTNAIARQILTMTEERGRQDSVLVEQAKQITRFMDREDGYRQQIEELENAVRTVKQYAGQGDLEARQALDEARASGDTDHLYAVLKRITDEVFEKQQAEFISRCREIASLAYVRGDIAEAEKRLDTILQHLPKDLNAINQQGHIAKLRGELDEAVHHFKILLELSEDESHHAVAYGNLGTVYQTRGELDQAEQMFNQSLKINERVGNRRGMAIQYGNLGKLYEIHGELDQAEQMLHRSIEITERLNDQEVMAAQHGKLGLVYEIRGELDQAEQMFNQSLKIHERVGNQHGMAIQYSNLGMIYRARGELDQAEQKVRQSLEINEHLGSQEGMAANYNILGAISYTRKDRDQAEQMFRQSLEINERLGRQEGVATQCSNIGMVYLCRFDFEQAEKMFRESLEINERLGSQHEKARQYGNLGLIHWARGEFDQAVQMHRQALEIKQRLGIKGGMAADYTALGLIYKTGGDMESARECLRQAIELYERMGLAHEVEQTQHLLDELPTA